MTRRNLKAKDAPVATTDDLVKWARLVKAAIAAAEAPGETKDLVKARNATRRACAMPRGQHHTASAFFRLSRMAMEWTSLRIVQRRELAEAFAALAVQCRELLDNPDPAPARRRVDIED
jgi:hypothetical protein